MLKILKCKNYIVKITATTSRDQLVKPVSFWNSKPKGGGRSDDDCLDGKPILLIGILNISFETACISFDIVSWNLVGDKSVSTQVILAWYHLATGIHLDMLTEFYGDIRRHKGRMS